MCIMMLPMVVMCGSNVYNDVTNVFWRVVVMCIMCMLPMEVFWRVVVIMCIMMLPMEVFWRVVVMCGIMCIMMLPMEVFWRVVVMCGSNVYNDVTNESILTQWKYFDVW